MGVRTTSLAGAVVVVLVWALNQLAGVEVPPEVAGALGVIVAAVGARLFPSQQAG